MAFITQVKKDMEFYGGLGSLLRVLKSVAISQFHVFERKIDVFEEFSSTVDGFLSGIDLSGIRHPFLTPTTNKLGIIVITSDSGLLGGLNMHVMNAAYAQLEKQPGKLIIVGEKGKIYAKERGVEFSVFSGVKDQDIYSRAIELRNYVIAEVLNGNIGAVQIIYPHAYSLVTQKIVRLYVLPYAAKDKDSVYIELDKFILESSIERVTEYLVYLWLGKRLYEILNMSKLAEYAARFMHLEECSNKLGKKDERLKTQYCRLKHELTDRGMRELFAARIMQGHK